MQGTNSLFNYVITDTVCSCKYIGVGTVGLSRVGLYDVNATKAVCYATLIFFVSNIPSRTVMIAMMTS